MSNTKEEKFFEQWYDKNEKRFHHGQFSEKQIAYSAFVNGFNYNREIISELEQENRELRKTLKQCMTWLQKESKSMPNYNITHSVLWQSFEEMLNTGGER